MRAYDDGVAFRYRLDGSDPVRLRGERTAFVPAGDPGDASVVPVADGAHEVPFERRKVSQLRDGVGLRRAGRVHHAVRRHRIRHHPGQSQGYTGASLWREGGALRVRLSPVPKRPGPAYVSHGGLTTAWRVVMMGDRAGDLIGSQLVGNLNPPRRRAISAGSSPARRRGTGGPVRWPA